MLEGSAWEIVQYASFILALITLFFTFKRAMLNKQWWMDLPMFILMTHGVVFYGLLIFYRIENMSTTFVFTPWSSLLRFHSYATLAMLAIVNYLKERNKWI